MTATERSGDLVGQVLGGRYRVTGVLGRGGMGVVGRAVDELLHREVAVKVLRAYTDAGAPELADLRERMRREAQAAARIRHGGVVTVYDVIEEGGLPVIVMELVDGRSLDEMLAERGAIEPHEAAEIGARLMDALDAAHRVGVLHRDVKPGNVLIERGGRVVLGDFGIASVDSSGEEGIARMTRSGELVGSLDYLPPERAQGREPSPASDIWSLGMTLYAAVEGASPFRRTSVWSTLSAIVSEPLPEPRRAGPLTPVLQALMAKEPERRPTAEGARAMLERVAAGGFAGPSPAGPSPASAYPPLHPPQQLGTPSANWQAAEAGHGTSQTEERQPAYPGYGYPHPGPNAPDAGPDPAAAPAVRISSAHRNTLPLPDGKRGRSRGRLIAVGVAAVLVAGGAGFALLGHSGTGGNGGKPHSVAAGGRTGRGGQDVGSGLAQRPAGSGSHGRGGLRAPAQEHTGRATHTTPAPASPASPASHGPSAPHSPGGATSSRTAVPTGCTGWQHRDPQPGTSARMTGSYHLESGPYESCSSVALASSGALLYLQCDVVNAYGNKWVYVRISGTSTTGWMSDDNLTGQVGTEPHC